MNQIEHFSWKDISDFSPEFFKKIYFNNNKCEFADYFQHNIIPVYDANKLDFNNTDALESIYKNFFNNTGVFIVKNAYKSTIMDNLNEWFFDNLENAKKDLNSKHPKQSGKYLINDVIGRMSETDPELLIQLLANNKLTMIIDLLLGFSKYGSATAHIISEGGDRQKSHVDYPGHIGSGLFWENSIQKFKKLTTRYQTNNILPYYSVQVLIATQYMDINNGSTEVIPGSHLIDDLDIKIHNKKIYDSFEDLFLNVTLQKGDYLVFNRRICHRGGKNLSNKPRNSLILQCIWLWGISQEIIDSEKVINYLNKTKYYSNLNDIQKSEFIMRLKSPYPINVKKNT